MKKNFILILFAFCLVQGKVLASCDTTIVVGNILGLNDSTIRMIIPILDSTQTYNLKVKKGKFEWKGVITQPERTYLFMQKHYMQFYMDTGNVLVNINGNVDFLDKATVVGSQPQKEYERYNSYIADAMNKYKALFEDKTYKAGHNKNKESEVTWENERKEALSEITKKTKEFILDHPSSIVSLSLIEDYTKVYDNEIADTLYQKLSLHAQQTNAGIRIFKKLAVYKRTEIGQPFSDFVQNDTSGHPIMLSNYKGKYVL